MDNNEDDSSYRDNNNQFFQKCVNPNQLIGESGMIVENYEFGN